MRLTPSQAGHRLGVHVSFEQEMLFLSKLPPGCLLLPVGAHKPVSVRFPAAVLYLLSHDPVVSCIAFIPKDVGTTSAIQWQG